MSKVRQRKPADGELHLTDLRDGARRLDEERMRLIRYRRDEPTATSLGPNEYTS